MALLIPTRKAPANGSFPTSPEDVRRWLGGIQPLSYGESQRLLYRGLKHSNRLESNNRNRVEVIRILEPAVDHVLDELSALYFEQPLPLPRKPLNAHQLASDLLREMGFAWKIVVNDTYSSLLGGQNGLRSTAIFHALRVLGKTILHHSLVYAPVPEGLLQDANTLFRMAEESGLENVPVGVEHPGFATAGEDDTWTIRQAYVHVQMLSLASLKTHRRRQIPLLSDFLESISERVDLTIPKPHYPASEKWLAIHAEQDTPAQLCNQFAPKSRRNLRAFNVSDIMVQIDRAERLAPESLAWEMESSVLRRNTLQNLGLQLVDSADRRSARLICKQAVGAKAGLKEIHALLVEDESREQDIPLLETNSPRPLPAENWDVINRSKNGLCLRFKDGKASDVQAGELVSVVAADVDKNRHADNKPAVSIGQISWIHYDMDHGLECGIELLASNASAVLVEGTTSNTRGSKLECLLCLDTITAADGALANTNFNGQTLIAPPHTFQESGSVRMHHDGQSSDWLVKSRRRASGGFDFFELSPRPVSRPATSIH